MENIVLVTGEYGKHCTGYRRIWITLYWLQENMDNIVLVTGEYLSLPFFFFYTTRYDFFCKHLTSFRKTGFWWLEAIKAQVRCYQYFCTGIKVVNCVTFIT